MTQIIKFTTTEIEELHTELVKAVKEAVRSNDISRPRLHFAMMNVKSTLFTLNKFNRAIPVCGSCDFWDENKHCCLNPIGQARSISKASRRDTCDLWEPLTDRREGKQHGPS